MSGHGVNVDQCVRHAEAAMCGDVAFHAAAIAAIPNESQKVRVFRRKTAEVIGQILMRLSEEIRKSIISKYYPNGGVKLSDIILRQSSDNNREGADLYHICGTKRVVIEVKFGDETSRNIGMAMFERIFGTDVFTAATCLSVRKNWERAFLSEGRNAQLQFERLWTAINRAIDKFNSLNESRGFVLPRANQEYMEKEILNTTGSGGEQDEFMKFVLDGEAFDDFKKIPTGIGRWTIDRVHHVDGRSVSRCNVFVRNYDTNVEIKYVLNWKNNHPLLGNVHDKVSAKLGLGTPSWNVWVEVEVTMIKPTL